MSGAVAHAARVSAAGLAFGVMLSCGGGGGIGGLGNFGGGGGGGGGGRGAYNTMAIAEEDRGDAEVVEEVEEVEKPEEEEEKAPAPAKKEYTLEDNFKVKQVVVLNEPDVEGLPSVESMVSGFKAKKQKLVDKKCLKDDIDRIMQTGLFENVNVRVVPVGPNEAKITYELQERQLSPVYSVTVAGTTILPEDIVDNINKKFRGVPALTPALLGWARNRIDGWYRERGLAFGCVSHFEGVESGAITVQCFEGVIDQVKVLYETRCVPHTTTTTATISLSLPPRALPHDADDLRSRFHPPPGKARCSRRATTQKSGSGIPFPSREATTTTSRTERERSETFTPPTCTRTSKSSRG